jgi:hypothetical protein
MARTPADAEARVVAVIDGQIAGRALNQADGYVRFA